MDLRTRNWIRQALLGAQQIDLGLSRFNLSGRGHEPRVTLNRSLAATVRNLGLVSVYISGFGANDRYPRRVFERAERMLRSAGMPEAAEALRQGYS